MPLLAERHETKHFEGIMEPRPNERVECRTNHGRDMKEEREACKNKSGARGFAKERLIEGGPNPNSFGSACVNFTLD